MEGDSYRPHQRLYEQRGAPKRRRICLNFVTMRDHQELARAEAQDRAQFRYLCKFRAASLPLALNRETFSKNLRIPRKRLFHSSVYLFKGGVYVYRLEFDHGT